MRGTNANGKRIRQLRKSAGYTQEQLAGRAGCDVRTIRKAEKNGRLDLATLSRIAAGLEVTSADIAEGADGSREKEAANVHTIYNWQDAFNRRDVDAVLDCWHDDGVLHILGAADIPAGGSFQGKEELRAHYEMAFQTFDTERISRDRMEITAADDFVFLRGEASVTHIPTGRKMPTYAVHEFRLEDGKIIERLTYVDTHAFYWLVQDGEEADDT